MKARRNVFLRAAGEDTDAHAGGTQGGVPRMGQARQSLPQRAADGQIEGGLAVAESPHGMEGGGSPIEANPGVRHQVRELILYVLVASCMRIFVHHLLSLFFCLCAGVEVEGSCSSSSSS